MDVGLNKAVPSNKTVNEDSFLVTVDGSQREVESLDKQDATTYRLQVAGAVITMGQNVVVSGRGDVEGTATLAFPALTDVAFAAPVAP